MSNKVLVIEDDPATSRLIEYSLKHHGFIVVTAANGLDGIQKAHLEAPDLVILDVMLPGFDGYEICRRLRSGKDTAQLPIIIFSARAQEIDKQNGISCGADDYLTKPAAPAEIVARVYKLLSKKNGHHIPDKLSEDRKLPHQNPTG